MVIHLTPQLQRLLRCKSSSDSSYVVPSIIDLYNSAFRTASGKDLNLHSIAVRNTAALANTFPHIQDSLESWGERPERGDDGEFESQYSRP